MVNDWALSAGRIVGAAVPDGGVAAELLATGDAGLVDAPPVYNGSVEELPPPVEQALSTAAHATAVTPPAFRIGRG